MRAVILVILFSLTACHGSQSSDDLVTDMNSNPVEASSALENDGDMLWVTSPFAEAHSCPSTRCGVTSRLDFRQGITPFEKRDGWVRETKVYDAACENGVSPYFKKGDKSCTADNGVRAGKFAEWVKDSQLSKTRPPDPADKATADEQLVKDSDDFARYHAVFAKLAHQLITDGRCSEGDFVEQGGFTKSVQRQDEPVYFTYCGSAMPPDKIIINAQSATIE